LGYTWSVRLVEWHGSASELFNGGYIFERGELLLPRFDWRGR
jgi:hypothetical protein